MSENYINTPISQLKAFVSNSKNINAVVETPKGSRNKYKYEPTLGLFTLHRVLTAGTVFPYDFGFIPQTLGADGDPLDVLVILDTPSFTGCLVQARLIGVLEAEQTEVNGKTERNDRFVAVALESQDYKNLQSLQDISATQLDQLEHFFISYTEMQGKHFKPVGRSASDQALAWIRDGVRAYEAQTSAQSDESTNLSV